MEAIQTKIESQAIALSPEAFGTFCEDIGGMFGIEMQCEQREVVAETVKGLKKRFKKLVVIYTVEAKGALGGKFHLLFDQAGLFATSGTIVMQPEKRILEQIKQGTAKDAEHLGDAVGECGNLLIGSWDRVFREEMDGQGHFLQAGTYIGTPWDNPEEAFGSDVEEEFQFVSCEMTIDPFPTFHCGVLFPKSLFAQAPASVEEPTAASDEAANPDEEPAETIEERSQKEDETQAEEVIEQVAEETSQETVQADKDIAADEPESIEKTSIPEEVVEEEEVQSEQESEEIAVEQKTEEKTAVTNKSQGLPVSESIQEMVQSPATLPGEHTFVSSAICAKDIMEKEVVWGNSEDSVQQALTKMQQAYAGYMLVETDGQFEGIVSKSDITGAVSIYLRPLFAKWRRPLDDATLQIKIKWIMSRPVHTVKSDTPLPMIMETMRQYANRALPVMDEQGKVQGLITVFDIFKALSDDNENVFSVGKTPQMPPLI